MFKSYVPVQFAHAICWATLGHGIERFSAVLDAIWAAHLFRAAKGAVTKDYVRATLGMRTQRLDCHYRESKLDQEPQGHSASFSAVQEVCSVSNCLCTR